MLDFNKLSYWEKETYINHTDYLIIGSGIVGLSTAIHLKEREPHKKVTVLERGYLPTGASTKNAGFACIGSPSELLDDLKSAAETTVFETVKKRWDGLNYLRALLGDETIEYRNYGSYELFRSKDEVSYSSCLEKLPWLNTKLHQITGIENVFEIDQEICNTNEFNGFKNAIKHNAEGQINTGKMLDGLVQLAQRSGVQILNGISVTELKANAAVTNYGEIPFTKVALCTNGFAQQFLENETIKPARAQVIITSEIQNLPFKGIYHFDEGYYYFRNINGRVLFGGGRNLDKRGEETTTIENTTLITAELERILRHEILPNHDFSIAHQWAGVMGVGDGKNPIIKKLNTTTYCGVRLGGMGVAIGTLVGKELAQLMQDKI